MGLLSEAKRNTPNPRRNPTWLDRLRLLTSAQAKETVECIDAYIRGELQGNFSTAREFWLWLKEKSPLIKVTGCHFTKVIREATAENAKPKKPSR